MNDVIEIYNVDSNKEIALKNKKGQIVFRVLFNEDGTLIIRTDNIIPTDERRVLLDESFSISPISDKMVCIERNQIQLNNEKPSLTKENFLDQEEDEVLRFSSEALTRIQNYEIDIDDKII